MIEAAKIGTLPDLTKEGFRARFPTKTISPEYVDRNSILNKRKINARSQSVLFDVDLINAGTDGTDSLRPDKEVNT